MARQLTSSDLVIGDEVEGVTEGGTVYAGTVTECSCDADLCPWLRLHDPEAGFAPFLTGSDGRLFFYWQSVRITRPFPGVTV